MSVLTAILCGGSLGDGLARRRGSTSAAVAMRVVVVGVLGCVAGGCSAQATPSPTHRLIAGARVEQAAALLPDGRVLIVGGSDGGYKSMATAELYDPDTNTFSATDSMTAVRQGVTATLLLDGRVLVSGGGGKTFELYDENRGTFTSGGNAGDAAWDSVAMLLPDGHVYLTEGGGSGIYDPTSGSFSANATVSGGQGIQSHVLLKNGRVLSVGGSECTRIWSNTGGCADKVWFDWAAVVDPEVPGRASAARLTMTMRREGPTATLLRDGKVLIAGGRNETADAGPELAAAELYDPATNIFSPTGSMLTPRTGHTATLLPGGRVLITGGGVPEVELYDPATGKFSLGGRMSEPRAGETATVLQDGRVLIAGGGGVGGVLDASAELYDPATETFTQAGSMLVTAPAGAARSGSLMTPGASAPVSPAPSGTGGLGVHNGKILSRV